VKAVMSLSTGNQTVGGDENNFSGEVLRRKTCANTSSSDYVAGDDGSKLR